MRTRAHFGLSYVEVLIAVLLLSMATAAALASWRMSTQAAIDKRATEMGVYVGVNELERFKAMTYGALPDDTSTSGYHTDCYDKFGVWIGYYVSPNYYDAAGALIGASPPANYTYQAQYKVTTVAPNPPSGTTKDLREVEINVYNLSGTTRLETVKTLLTFGGF